MKASRFLIISIITCLMIGCGKSDENIIQDSVQMENMIPYLQRMIQWSYQVDAAKENLVFEQMVLMSNGDCPDTNSSVDRAPNIDPPTYKTFVENLGFRSVTELQNWFVAYGKFLYDLKHQVRPDDVKEFTDVISNQMIEKLELSSCRELSIRTINYSAYMKAFTYGLSVGTEGKASCDGAALYGEGSSINLIIEFMKSNSACNI